MRPAINLKLLMIKQKGFTLLEVLIAIVITAIIGLGSWQLLNGAIKASEISERQLQQLAKLQKTMMFIARDMEQILPRSVRDEYGDRQPALKSKSEFLNIEFTRAGWRNPLEDPRSELQRVAYELNNGELIRHYWRVLDRAQDSTSKTKVLLDKIEGLEIAYLSDTNSWQSDWPPQAASDSEETDPLYKYNILPKAVRITIEHPAFGQLNRLFDLSVYVPSQEFVAGSEDNNNDQNQNNDESNNQNGVQP